MTEKPYQFVTCKGCKKQLPVGTHWSDGTEIECNNCGSTQEI